MSTQAEPLSPTPEQAKPGEIVFSDIIAAFPAAFWLVVFMCALFTATGGGLAWLYGFHRGFPEGAGFAVKLAIKVIAFAAMALWSLVALWRRFDAGPGDDPLPLASPPETWLTQTGFMIVLLACAAVVLPRLTAYPWMAPDESYHLGVARNVAEYGLYASGHPDAGFVLFNVYDSVGPPVILPIAAVFDLLGSSLIAARLVVVVFFLLTLLVMYYFARPLVGDPAALLGTLMLVMTGSTIYLARTVYGEVPAFFFMMLGLLLWRQALAREVASWPGILAGMCFAMSALSKTMVLLSAFAFLGALVYDRFTYRRLRLCHVAIPAVGFVFVWMAWGAYEAGRGGGLEDTLAVYQSLLIFGLDGVRRTTREMLSQPGDLVAFVASLLLMMPVVFRKRYDPPAITLFLIAVLYSYWWFFFTPGQIPRYLWFSRAAAVVFLGAVLWRALRGVTGWRSGWGRRIASAAILAIIVVPASLWMAGQARLVYGADEMADDFALSRYVAGLPRDARIASAYYPLGRTLNFLAGRHVPWVGSLAEAAGNYDMVIFDGQTQSHMFRGRRPLASLGRYVIMNPVK